MARTSVWNSTGVFSIHLYEACRGELLVAVTEAPVVARTGQRHRLRLFVCDLVGVCGCVRSASLSNNRNFGNMNAESRDRRTSVLNDIADAVDQKFPR